MGSSAPASAISHKSKSTLDKFANATAREDKTTRKVIELREKCTDAAHNMAMAKLQAKFELKKAKEAAKLRLLEKKMDHQQQYRLTQLQQNTARVPFSPLIDRGLGLDLGLDVGNTSQWLNAEGGEFSGSQFTGTVSG